MKVQEITHATNLAENGASGRASSSSSSLPSATGHECCSVPGGGTWASGAGAQTGPNSLLDETVLRNVVFIKTVHGNRFIYQLVPVGQSTVNVLEKTNLQNVLPFSVAFILASISTCDFSEPDHISEGI